MASLVDLTPSAPANLLADSDVTALMSGFQSVVPLPTPPLSPQHLEVHTDSSAGNLAGYTINHSVEGSLEDQEASALLDQMLKCEGFAVTDPESFLSTDGSPFVSTPESDSLLLSAAQGMELLIQDCMWNSHAYEPRSIIGNVNGGVYTPAPSPPPPAEQPQETEEQQDVKENSDSGNDNETNEEPAEVQAECISPCDIFPAYTLVADKEGSHVATKPLSVTCAQSEGARHHQAMSSESDEEIDVVTVTTERPPATRMTTRKRTVSISAPCSRQTSPAPPSPKKRKYTVKRLQRINSNTSSVGDGAESDDEHRRASHNILERKRRNDLKFSFQILREQVPDLEENQRAPKVTILRKAAEYIRRIQVESNASEQELERERKRETKLRQRLAFLKAMPVLA